MSTFVFLVPSRPLVLIVMINSVVLYIYVCFFFVLNYLLVVKRLCRAILDDQYCFFSSLFLSKVSTTYCAQLADKLID